MQAIDKVRVENFDLKKQIAYDKKKYMDLKSAFLELRASMKEQEKEYSNVNPDL